MPHILAPPTNMSFGHFSSIFCGSIWLAIASPTASAVTKDKVDGAGSLVRQSTMVLQYRLPSGLCHVRPRRPLPPDWRSARSHKPSLTDGSACCTRDFRSALVDPVSATVSIRMVRTRPEQQWRLWARVPVWPDTRAEIQQLPSARSARSRSCCRWVQSDWLVRQNR